MADQLLDILNAGLDELSIEIPADAPERLAALAQLVASWGARINLTGHRTARAIAERLILDAGSLWATLRTFDVQGSRTFPRTTLGTAGSSTRTPQCRVADLGSGAGFPGLPVAILDPATLVRLVEARERRHHFQRHVVRELGLENVEAELGRFEDLRPTPSEIVVAQAVARPPAIIAAMGRWAAPGGLLVVPGGTVPDEAPNHAEDGGQTLTYQVPLGGPGRTLWIRRSL